MNSVVVFLIQTFFDLYISILLLRMILQFFNANYYNPISQFVVKLTNPLLLPLRRFLPRFKYIDISIILLAVILDFIKFIILVSLSDVSINIFVLSVLVVLDLLKQIINIFFYAVLLRVILSWISPQYGANPVMDVLVQITEPLLAPIRRVIPPIAGFDLSPLFVLIGLKALTILLVAPFWS